MGFAAEDCPRPLFGSDFRDELFNALGFDQARLGVVIRPSRDAEAACSRVRLNAVCSSSSNISKACATLGWFMLRALVQGSHALCAFSRRARTSATTAS